MKKIVLLIVMVFGVLTISNAQSKMNEQRCIKESHIDFTKEYIYFTIHGLIEIDGHIFKNDTCKCPIQFQANLEGIVIIDTCQNIKYEYRKCSKPDCKIIHLIEKIDVNYYKPGGFQYFLTPNSL